MPRGCLPRHSDPNYKPTAPIEPLRKLSEGLLGAELHKAPLKLTIKFDDRADARDVHRVLTGLQDCYKAERE